MREKTKRFLFLTFLFSASLCLRGHAQTLVQISDTLYNADGTKASGRIVISWSPFTTADNVTVDGGEMAYTIPATGPNAGEVDVSLAPNAGSSPAGTSYQARYILANGADYRETWVVPASGPATIAQVRVPTVPTPTATYLTMLNGLTATTQTFSRTNDSNATLAISSSGGDHHFALGWAGALGLLRGGTNQTSWTASRCVRVNDAGTALESASGDCGAGGGGPHNLLSATHPDTAAASPLLGDLLYANATPAWTKLAGNTTATKQFLTQSGTGSASAAPAWGAIAAGDLPSHTHAESDVTGLVSDLAAKEATANKNQANGYAGLDTGGLLAASQLPLPSATTLGGVKSLTCTGTDKLSAIGTDGVPVCAADQSGGSSHNLLSATHTDTTTAAPTRGDIITAQGASPTWSRLAKGTQYQMLQAGASEPAYDAVHLDQSAAVTGILGSTNGGTGNGFTKFSGPASTEKTFTLPNASATILTDNAAVTVAQGGTGAATLTGVLLGNGTSAVTAMAILGSVNGGTGNGFSKFSGPTTSEKTFTLPDVSATILTTNAAVTPAQGGTGQSTTATTGRYLKGDGTNWGTSSGAASGTGACSANTWASTLNSDAAPTCTQPDFSNVSGTVGDTQIAAGAVDGGSGGEIADGTVDSNDLATANKTITKSVNIFSPVTSDTNLIQFYWPAAVTLQRIACSTDTGTVSINFDERAEATPNTAGTNTLSSALVCDTDSQVTTSFSDSVIAADVPHNLQITATSGTPGIVRIHVKTQIN